MVMSMAPFGDPPQLTSVTVYSTRFMLPLTQMLPLSVLSVKFELPVVALVMSVGWGKLVNEIGLHSPEKPSTSKQSWKMLVPFGTEVPNTWLSDAQSIVRLPSEASLMSKLLVVKFGSKPVFCKPVKLSTSGSQLIEYSVLVNWLKF